MSRDCMRADLPPAAPLRRGALALAGGLGAWVLAGWVQRPLATLSGLAAGALGAEGYAAALMRTAPAALSEEAIRWGLIGLFAPLLRRAIPDLRRRGRALFGMAALAGWAFGAAENLSYFLAFPDAASFWRLLYSMPVHLNAALLYALAWGRADAGDAARPGPAAPALGLTWHLAFNAAALALPARVAAPVGGGLNLIAFLALAYAAERRFVLRGVFYGYDRLGARPTRAARLLRRLYEGLGGPHQRRRA